MWLQLKNIKYSGNHKNFTVLIVSAPKDDKLK